MSQHRVATRRRSALIAVAASTLVACGEPPSPPAADEPSALVTTWPVSPRTVHATLVAYGTAEFAAGHVVAVVAMADGVVTARLATPGDVVRRGQALLRMRPDEPTRLALDAAQRQAAQARAELARLQRLHDESLSTDVELGAARQASADADDQYRSLRRRSDGSGLVAPCDGIVQSLDAEPGAVITAASIVARVASPRDLQMRLGIAPEQIGRVRAGEIVRLTRLGDAQHPVAGVIAAVDPRVDAGSHLASARLRVDGAEAFAAGTALHGEIVTDTRAGVLAVPHAALLHADDARPYLFVDDAGHARRVEVATGIEDGDWVEVADGLQPGQPVVVSGNYELQDGMRLRQAPAAPVAPGPAAKP